jgi:membrane protein implicated in regulation of membrane protease activity
MTSARRVRANPIYQNVISALCVDGAVMAWSPFHRTWLNLAAALALVVVVAFLGWLDVRDARREGDGAS